MIVLNSKLQIPNPKQAANPKLPIGAKEAAKVLPGVGTLGFIWILDFGFWIFPA
jgi:hypothetical protein